jgi:predicted DNA-binding protein YlxM (UPF0122 family)
MDKILEQSLLYDFYGELLNEHQRRVYESYLFEDLSLGELAEELGISRQGVHDMVRRCDKSLREYEDKLHLVERFSRAKEELRSITELTGGDHLSAEEAGKRLKEIRRLASALAEDF